MLRATWHIFLRSMPTRDVHRTPPQRYKAARGVCVTANRAATVRLATVALLFIHNILLHHGPLALAAPMQKWVVQTLRAGMYPRFPKLKGSRRVPRISPKKVAVGGRQQKVQQAVRLGAACFVLRAALLPAAWPTAPCPVSAPFPHRDSMPVSLAFKSVALSTAPQAQNGRLRPLRQRYSFSHLQHRLTKKCGGAFRPSTGASPACMMHDRSAVNRRSPRRAPAAMPHIHTRAQHPTVNNLRTHRDYSLPLPDLPPRARPPPRPG